MPNPALDAIAWSTLDSIVPRPRPARRLGGEVRNYAELWETVKATGDRHWAWSTFLHGFYQHKDVEAFAVPPAAEDTPQYRALYAAVAEYLCRRYGLSIPAWTEEPQYFLRDRWELIPLIFHGDDEWVSFPCFDGYEDLWGRCEEEFRRRGLAFQARGLITI